MVCLIYYLFNSHHAVTNEHTRTELGEYSLFDEYLFEVGKLRFIDEDGCMAGHL